MYHKMAFSGLILIKKFRHLKRVVKINNLFERYTLWLMVVLFKGMEKRLKLYTHTHIVLLLKFWMVFVYIYVLILFKILFFMRCVISRGRHSKVGKVLTQSASLWPTQKSHTKFLTFLTLMLGRQRQAIGATRPAFLLCYRAQWKSVSKNQGVLSVE